MRTNLTTNLPIIARLFYTLEIESMVVTQALSNRETWQKINRIILWSGIDDKQMYRVFEGICNRNLSIDKNKFTVVIFSMTTHLWYG